MEDGESHFSLTNVFKHAVVMAGLMAISGSVMAIPMGIETNLANSVGIGLNGAIDMMVVDPVTSLGDYFSNFSGVGPYTYEWGSLSHSGMDMASHASGAVEHAVGDAAGHGASGSHFDPEATGGAMTDWVSSANDRGILSDVIEDCGGNLATCYTEQYSHLGHE